MLPMPDTRITMISILGAVRLDLETIFSYVFAPFGFLMGLDAENILQEGMLLGQKLALNEFVAFGYKNYHDFTICHFTDIFAHQHRTAYLSKKHIGNSHKTFILQTALR